MDTVTHLVAGALTPLAFRNAPKTRMLTLFGIIAGEFPDIDVVAGRSAEAVLSFHRGFTHALVLQPVFALLLALVFHRALKKGDRDGTWTFAKTWSVALLALVIHLFLDCMTTFGTQVLLPFSDFRVALPAMYIIDLAMTLPLLAVWIVILRRGGSGAAAERRVPLARRALAWIFVYPLCCLALNFGLTAHLEKLYAAPGNAQGMTRMELSPEPFAPLNWKAVGISRDAYFMGRVFLPRMGREIPFTRYERVNPELWAELQRDAPLFSLYAKFATYPFQTAESRSGETLYTFRDVRYEATLPGLINAVGRSDGLFLMQARVKDGRPQACRFLHRGRESDSTPWLPVVTTGGASGTGASREG
ncbi:metal-dependent hydrolase [Desulfovibrio sp. OttesenSCG-928-O18]|nr:metal-dependent hydrolase [Desulfovibrio sp. OttesenSCG-928-O18]